MTAKAAADSLNTLVPDVDVTVDQLTNSIILVGPDSNVQRAKTDVLPRLDVAVAVERVLKNNPSNKSNRRNPAPQREEDPDRDQPQPRNSEAETAPADDAARSAFELEVLLEKLKSIEALKDELENANIESVQP